MPTSQLIQGLMTTLLSVSVFCNLPNIKIGKLQRIHNQAVRKLKLSVEYVT